MYDHLKAAALRTAINETLRSILPPPFGTNLPSDAKQMLSEHLSHLLAQEAALLTFTAPALAQPTVAAPAAEAPWYPDDSGQWVEHDGRPACPVPPNTEVEALKRFERARRSFNSVRARAYQFNWHDTVAYKVVS